MITFETVLGILALMLMMASLIAGVVWYYRKSKKEVLELGFVFQVRCEKCQTEFEVSTEEFLKHSSSKSKSVTKPKVKEAFIDNSPHYTYMAKRFDCPVCKSVHWAEVLNYGEYQVKTLPIDVFLLYIVCKTKYSKIFIEKVKKVLAIGKIIMYT